MLFKLQKTKGKEKNLETIMEKNTLPIKGKGSQRTSCQNPCMKKESEMKYINY